MAIITSTTTVTIGDAAPVTTTLDFTLGASTTGTGALRRLVYPDATALAPIVYTKNPDDWTNFDVTPLVKRPRIGVLKTLEDNKITGWQGYARDSSITETWRGSDSVASITLDFLRQLYAYYETPPLTSFIQWEPRDRTASIYNIVIESLTVGGQDIHMNYIAANAGYVTGDVVLRFRIVSEV
jgi:hypothetical protein